MNIYTVIIKKQQLEQQCEKCENQIPFDKNAQLADVNCMIKVIKYVYGGFDKCGADDLVEFLYANV